MRKIVAAIVTIIAAAVIGIPPLIGNLTEQRIMAQAELAKAMTDKAYDFEVLEYNSGWFGSTALVEVNLNAEHIQQIVDTVSQEDDMATAITAMVIQSFLDKPMPIQIEIGHGPIIFGNDMQFGILSSVIRIGPRTEDLSELLNILDIPYLFEVSTLTRYIGVLGFTGVIPPIEVASGNAEISFSGFNIEGSYDISARQTNSIVSLESLRASAPGIGAVVIEDILLTIDGTNHPSILWLGKVATNIANITVNGTTPRGPFDLEIMNAGASFDTAMDDQKELISIEGSYYVNSFQSLDDLDLTLARINFSLSNFSREAIEEYLAYSQLVANDPRTAPPLIPGIQDMIYLTLATSPTIQIGPITFLWQGEPFDADLRLDIDGSVLPPQNEFSMLDIRTITNSITATGFTEMSPELAETLIAELIKYQMSTGAALSGNQTSEDDLNTIADLQAIGMLLGLVAQDLLVESDTGYRSAFKFENRELTINDHVFPIDLPL